jgi:hypothetical protein
MEKWSAGFKAGWNGAHALGNRSILADPRRAHMKDVLNAKIKRRAVRRHNSEISVASPIDLLTEFAPCFPAVRPCSQLRAPAAEKTLKFSSTADEH